MCHAWITHWTVTRAPLTMPDDEARVTNAHTVEMRANPFWRARKPIWRLEHPFLNWRTRRARKPKNRAW